MDNAYVLLLFFTIIMTSRAQGCPSGFVTHGSSCYHFSHDTESWVGAMQTCSLLDSQLVEINDEPENKFLQAQAKLLNNNYWIALSDIREEGTWIWMNSKTPLTTTSFSDWSPGQPNNYQADENCACIYHYGQINWKWNDCPCHLNLHYICETTEKNTEVVG